MDMKRKFELFFPFTNQCNCGKKSQLRFEVIAVEQFSRNNVYVINYYYLIQSSIFMQLLHGMASRRH
jgi:hypothetical protein